MYLKFLHTKDIDKGLGDGTLMISSLEYFRKLEEAEWPDIADPLDGASELTVKGEFIIREGSTELDIVNAATESLGLFKGKFAAVSGGGIINMSGARFIPMVPRLFIYCVTVGNIDELTAQMCTKGNEPYDACLKIENIEGLQQRIFASGRICGMNCAVGDLFLPGLIGAVVYEPRSLDIREGPGLEPSPFKKGERFRGQSEVRMLFVPKDSVSIPDERLKIEIQRPTEFFTEMFKDYAKISQMARESWRS
jgi:hypothetical protein